MKNKKILLSMLCVMVFTFTGCAGNTTAGNTGTENAGAENTVTDNTATDNAATGNTTTENATITEEEAKKVALDDAGIAESDVTGLRIEKDKEDGYYVYEVEFYSENKEYDYKIDQTTGEIVGKDYEIENDFSN